MRTRTGFMITLVLGLAAIAAVAALSARVRPVQQEAVQPSPERDREFNDYANAASQQASTRESKPKEIHAVDSTAPFNAGPTDPAPIEVADEVVEQIADGEPRIVQLIIAKEDGDYRVAGLQEAPGEVVKLRTRPAPRDTHLFVVRDAEGVEIARGGANLSGRLYADAPGPDGKTLTGGVVRAHRATAAVRYVSRGDDVRLELRALRPANRGDKLAWHGDIR